MSLRPQIYGFRLATLEALLGSGDQSALASLKGSVSAAFPNDAGFVKQVGAILARAIDEGAPFDDVDDEGLAHVWAAHILAGSGQDVWDAASGAGKVQPTEIIFDQGAKLSARGDELIELLMGRALFGEAIETDGETYAWLTHDEVKELAQELSGDATAGLLNAAIAAHIADFRRWLAEIERRGLDLWYFNAPLS